MKRQEMFGNVEDAKRPKFSFGAIEQKGPVIIMSSRSKPDLVLNCKNGSYMVHISIVCQYSDLCSDIILNTLPDKFETHPLVDGKNPLRVIDFPETLVQEKDGMHACLDLMYNPESKMFLNHMAETCKVADALRCDYILKLIRKRAEAWVQQLCGKVKRECTPRNQVFTETNVNIVKSVGEMVRFVSKTRSIYADLEQLKELRKDLFIWYQNTICAIFKQSESLLNPIYVSLDEILTQNRPLRFYLTYGIIADE